MKYITILALLIFTFSSCRQDSMSPTDYLAWCDSKKSGLKIERTFDNISLSLLYKPIQFNRAMQLFRGDTSSVNLSKEDSSLIQFNLTIKSQTAEKNVLKLETDQKGYFERVNYFLQNAENDFKLIVGNREYPCVMCHFEPNYGLAPQNTLLLTFATDKTRYDEDLTLIFNDQVFGNGIVEIKLNGSDIKAANSILIN